MKLYTSQEAARETGATLRQLQYWDERRYVRPVHAGHCRYYSDWQIKQIKRMMEIRRTFQLRLRDIPANGKVRVITEPTIIGGVLIIPKVRPAKYA